MGNCKFCGKPAGFLRSKHAECEEENRKPEYDIQKANTQIIMEALAAIKGTVMFASLADKIAEIEQANRLSPAHRKPLLIRACEMAVDNFLEDGVLDTEEEKRLVEFRNHFGFSQDDLNSNGALTKTAKAGVLRDVLDGKIPLRLSVDGLLPINTQMDESVVWAFPASRYLEDKTCRHFVGCSQGVSIRVMKGVYYRVGAFNGEAIKSTERVHVDTGLVVVTNKNIHFAGPQKSLRIPYPKIVSFEPYSDGFGIMRDTTTAKPQLFVTGDGWFTYNLVTNLSQLEDAK